MDLWKYELCCLGIVISVALPPLWAIVKSSFAPASTTKSIGAAAATFWSTLAPYLALGVASILTAIILIAFIGDKITTFGGAILAGYAWDSTLQKFK